MGGRSADDLLEVLCLFFGRFAMAAQRAVRKLLLAVVALYCYS